MLVQFTFPFQCFSYRIGTILLFLVRDCNDCRYSSPSPKVEGGMFVGN